MGTYTTRSSEDLAIVSVINPVSQAAGTVTSTAVDMRLFRRVMFVLSVGAIGASGTVNMTIRGDTASGGPFTTAIAGKVITQLDAAGTDSNKQAIVEVTAEEVAAQNLRWVRAEVVVGTAASLISLVALGSNLRYGFASEYDLASVDEIVG